MLDDLTPGQVLGRYELLLPVAQGGMASVWAARLKGSRGFQKMVAIKTMLPGLVHDPAFEKMFLDEASLASQVRHPHVIEILDLGEQDHVLYIVMEWVDGEPLNIITKYAADRGGIPIPIAVHIAAQACRGLHAAHELRDDNGALVGLVHRDVSPQNVLVTYDGVVKVVDFGVAKATSRASVELTEAGQLKGKIAYMSPEQLRSERIDRRTDVFAVGILLYMMTTGRHPFRGEEETATIYAITSDDPPALPSTIVPSYPPALEQVVMLALAKDPAKRYATANDMLVGLHRALPPSLRSCTDEQVADFLRNLLPERLERRKAAIKAALDAAFRREHGKTLPLLGNSEPPRGQLTSEPSARPPSLTDTDPIVSAESSLPGATAHEMARTRTVPAAERPRRWINIGATLTLILGVSSAIVAVLTRGIRQPEASPTPSVVATHTVPPAAAASPTLEVTDAEKPSLANQEQSAEAASSVPVSATETLDAGMPTGKPEVTRTRKKSASSAASASAAETDTTAPPASGRKKRPFVSPIQDPGF